MREHDSFYCQWKFIGTWFANAMNEFRNIVRNTCSPFAFIISQISVRNTLKFMCAIVYIFIITHCPSTGYSASRVYRCECINILFSDLMWNGIPHTYILWSWNIILNGAKTPLWYNHIVSEAPNKTKELTADNWNDNSNQEKYGNA